MSFKSKTDYFGLGSTSLIITASDENKSAQVAQARNEKGDVVAEEVYGEMISPNCTYAVKSDASLGSIKIGDPITTSGNKKVSITSITIDTSAGSPPSIQVAGEEVPTTSHNDCYYTVPSATVKVCHHAQILWSAFSLSGDGCYLTQASYSASGDFTKATKDGETIAYDVSNGQLTVNVTIQQTDDDDPVVTPGTDWTITSPLTESNPDADYPTWTCTLTKNLNHPTSSSQS